MHYRILFLFLLQLEQRRVFEVFHSEGTPCIIVGEAAKEGRSAEGCKQVTENECVAQVFELFRLNKDDL